MKQKQQHTHAFDGTFQHSPKIHQSRKKKKKRKYSHKMRNLSEKKRFYELHMKKKIYEKECLTTKEYIIS